MMKYGSWPCSRGRGSCPSRSAGAGGGADEGKAWKIGRDAAGVWALVDDDVQLVVLHRGVEVLLDGGLQSVNLIDEKHVTTLERSQEPGQIAGLLDRRAAGVLD